MFRLIPRVRLLTAKREWLRRPTWGVYEVDSNTIHIVRQKKSTDIQVIWVFLTKLLEWFFHKTWIKRKKRT